MTANEGWETAVRGGDRVTQLIRDGESYDPGDVANAIDAFRTLYDNLLTTP